MGLPRRVETDRPVLTGSALEHVRVGTVALNPEAELQGVIAFHDAEIVAKEEHVMEGIQVRAHSVPGIALYRDIGRGAEGIAWK